MMANDPNRDLLPVKEESSGKCPSIDRFDLQILTKLPRCELEDKILRLLDEQTNLKKLVNCQEEKIKRLGTKLLRLIGEKKNGKKNSESSKETEELTIRITELEHENYALKDKNVVLKQQLANHSRHLTTHRSPVRSMHNSPLVSVRQPAPPMQTEMLFDASNKNVSSESQLREAESHIKDLNEEIKALHCKIDFLQQNMERSSLDSRKSKVTENIELIRLQRSLKQQAIQIAALQAQVKNSEYNQKILKEQLAKAHEENDEALHLISVKQNEIINLCNKLEEKNLSRLEEDELRERINDLMLERDSLKERSDFLMKSIGTKSEETARMNELKKLLANEKFKKEELEEALENMQKELINIKNEKKESRSPPRAKSAGPSTKETAVCQCRGSWSPKNRSRSLESEKKDKIQTSFTERKKENLAPFRSTVSLLTPEFETDSILSDTSKDEKVQDEEKILSDVAEGKYFADKLYLEREVQYLREMLRSQTCRCEAQQAEIKRLMFELRVNEEKCSDTLRKLDDHLKLFQDFQMKNQEHKVTLVDDGGGADSVKSTAEEIRVEKINRKEKKTRELKKSEKNDDLESGEPVKKRQNSESATSNLEQNIVGGQKSVSLQIERKKPVQPVQPEPKKRFIDQVFLESSDEESEAEKPFQRESVIKRLGDLGNEKEDVVKRVGEEPDSRWRRKASSYPKSTEKKISPSGSSTESDFKSPSTVNTKELEKKMDKDDRHLLKPNSSARGEVVGVSRFVEIGILWLKIDPESSVGQNDSIKLIFVDFSFLNVNGEETETPDSMQKPTKPDEKCNFNFWKIIDIDDNKKMSLQGMLNKPSMDLIVFKVVSEPEDNNMDFDCEDIGVAKVTVKQFLDYCAKGPFLIPVENMIDTTEVIGTLSVSVDASPEIFNYRK